MHYFKVSKLRHFYLKEQQATFTMQLKRQYTMMQAKIIQAMKRLFFQCFNIKDPLHSCNESYYSHYNERILILRIFKIRTSL